MRRVSRLLTNAGKLSRPNVRVNSLSVAARPLSTPAAGPASLDEFDVEFRDPLGSGAAGCAFMAQHRSTGREVAIKAVSTVMAQGDLTVEELQEHIGWETAAFKALRYESHPNVMACFGHFVGSGAEAAELGWHLPDDAVEHDMHWFVMELVAHGSLLDKIRAKRRADEVFDERQIAHAVRDVGDALSHLHGLGIVHRDIKPSNVLCETRQEDGPLKLIDFSVAGVVQDGGADLTHALKDRVGTAGYAAPEVLASMEYGPAADMYSLGCTVTAMISGTEAPRSAAEGAQAVADAPLTDECKRVLGSLLAENPADRPTAEELLADMWLERTFAAQASISA